jgi:hypothetical protein
VIGLPGDWRLPNLIEMRSLIDYTRIGPAITPDNPFAPLRYPYWSSTTSYSNPAGAWVVFFEAGEIRGLSKCQVAGVWPLRGPE